MVAVLVGMHLMAGDVIVLRNSTRIDAKILEVSDTEIKYKKSNNLDGPTFTQKVENISAVIYDNGDVTSYADQAPAQTTSQNSKASNASRNSGISTEKESNSKLQFNPQPSDNYWFGLTVGYMSKNQQAAAEGEKASASWLLANKLGVTPAIRFGMTMNPTFKYGLGLRSGLFLEYGVEMQMSGETIGHDVNLSVPLQFSYRYEIIPKLSILLYTGPIFDFGAYATIQYQTSSGKYEILENVYTAEGYKGFNCLWGIGGGIQWDRLRLDIGGDFGMVNKYKADVKDATDVRVTWNKPVYVTLTCFF